MQARERFNRLYRNHLRLGRESIWRVVLAVVVFLLGFSAGVALLERREQASRTSLQRAEAAVSPAGDLIAWRSKTLAIWEAVNQQREQHGVAPLSLVQTLVRSALAHCHDMVKYDYWAHVNPVTGATPWEFIDAAGYNYQAAAENLARVGPGEDVKNVVDSWMDSPEHRTNLLNGIYSETGIAACYGRDYGDGRMAVVVQQFAVPAN
jgi:uncharacterized protein YkwD